MKKITKNIWSKGAKEFMNVEHSSQKNVLHPILAQLINESQSSSLLDFGCGDGRLLKLLNTNINIDVYDINYEMLELTKHNLGDQVDNYIKDKKLINENFYEAIVLCNVLVCIDNIIEYEAVLNKIKSCKTDKGKVYIAVTHPCFREKKFSNFSTSYTLEPNEFNYLKDGKEFEVYIQDIKPPSIAFKDFHWSLSFTLNKIIEAGLSIERIIETKDDELHSNYNPNFSPFLIIIAK